MLASSAVHRLKSHFGGELIGPSDREYEAARKVFNITIDKRPALIARCTSADDVIQVLNLRRGTCWFCPGRATTLWICRVTTAS
jgi:hypothetical protein